MNDINVDIGKSFSKCEKLKETQQKGLNLLVQGDNGSNNVIVILGLH